MMLQLRFPKASDLNIISLVFFQTITNTFTDMGTYYRTYHKDGVSLSYQQWGVLGTKKHSSYD